MLCLVNPVSEKPASLLCRGLGQGDAYQACLRFDDPEPAGVDFGNGKIKYPAHYKRVAGLSLALLAALFGLAKRRVLRCVGVAIALNVLSHTVFWIGFPLVMATWPGGLLGAEGVVAAVEAIVYRLLCPLRWWQALLASVLLNGLSYLLGVEIWLHVGSS